MIPGPIYLVFLSQISKAIYRHVFPTDLSEHTQTHNIQYTLTQHTPTLHSPIQHSHCRVSAKMHFYIFAKRKSFAKILKFSRKFRNKENIREHFRENFCENPKSHNFLLCAPVRKFLRPHRRCESEIW